MTDEEMPGPVDFVLIEFPTGAPSDAVGQALWDLLDAGVVRLYDIVLVRKSADGRSERVDLTKPADGFGRGLEVFAGAQSGLFDDDDVAKAGDVLHPDRMALLIAFENAWAIPFVTAAYGAGGQLVASERIRAQTLVEALDMADAAS